MTIIGYFNIIIIIINVIFKESYVLRKTAESTELWMNEE